MPGDIEDERKHTPSRLLGRIWVGGTTLLVTTIAYSSQLFVVLPAYGNTPFHPQLWRQLLIFNVLVGMVFWNYFRTVRRDPGRVPHNWAPPQDDETAADQAMEVKPLSGRPRYCRSCLAYKPPRAHHCRQCRRCVLRMDHHCPWVNNCVGHRNYPDFVRFLFFVDIACSMHIYIVTKAAIYGPFGAFDPPASWVIWLVVNYTLCVPVLLAVGGFSIYHFYLMCRNMTTIESSEKERSATMRRRGQIRHVRFPYDLGWRANIQAVLGDKPLWWCWPQSMQGTGLSYPVSDELNPNAQWQWPPQPREGSRYHYYTSADESDEDTSRKGPLDPQGAFTYGQDLNPELLRHQLQQPDSALRVSGYDSEDEDDQPLAQYAGNRRVRRGSEGYEVRPHTISERFRSIGMDMPEVEAYEESLYESRDGEEQRAEASGSESEWDMDTFVHDQD